MKEKWKKEKKTREKSERTCEANDRANLDPLESKTDYTGYAKTILQKRIADAAAAPGTVKPTAYQRSPLFLALLRTYAKPRGPRDSTARARRGMQPASGRKGEKERECGLHFFV
jgi:hypothetical protein